MMSDSFLTWIKSPGPGLVSITHSPRPFGPGQVLNSRFGMNVAERLFPWNYRSIGKITTDNGNESYESSANL